MRIEENDLLITWPDDKQEIMLDVLDEDEDPISIQDYAFTIMNHWWNGPSHLTEGEKHVGFAEIIYPDKIRFYKAGKRVSLMRAHEALEQGLGHCLRIALDMVEQQVKDIEEYESLKNKGQ